MGDGAKRLFDIVTSLALLVLALPVMLVVALLVRWRLGSPVLFRQTRAGLRGRPFELLKFRTMTDARGPDGALRSDEARLTRFGRFLRGTTLDELPELWNVLRGDMSLVGPRPLYVHYIPRYTAFQSRRLEVRPGLTGWAVVHGRNALGWEDRFRLDVWYVDHRSFALDLKILWRTALLVFSRKGVSAEGHATMPEFTGAREREPLP
ncbi:MAG TPA: sugar transferase [Candidatus Thermoplasmatota archaeon]|nr:sugar transferase [Candidatus Thermoplasmatota archaeon]